MATILNLLWLVFMIMALVPMFNQRRLELQRVRLMREIELKRGSRLITLIHRQESINLLGIPISRFINIEDSEQVLRAIRLTPEDMPIDLVLHTPGGLVLASEQIASALSRHKAKVTVFIPHYAMSGGTMLALSADEIVMDENAVLGPVDPQIGQYPAASVIKVVEEKGKEHCKDETLILADIARKAMNQVETKLKEILADKFQPERAAELAKIFSEGRWTHDYPISYEQLRELGLPVSTAMPREIYELMEYYPQPPQRRPSVQYIPLPYFEDTRKTR
ncbi:MAG: SDH family Clp fold serine proteinase [Bacillota bacterium]|uniref:Serine protease, ClpP class n=2 Tax=Carboxydocella TaxID=178898 RepID=A0A1T4R226_9FIRM|nr:MULTISPECIES: hypothetical protein [Carboxydocella]AVX21763.1 serine protease, ClpP class [Carboxydocella thermautotrophica]AVX32169.1 serine protease, ClpP class [Carboxydocella thermautotrophica]SKA09993.1 serine protease, ClpP class [Carboxydocella sporoproducens DSM 16521]GAW27602.1 hypothetical protein ULO1_01720 [Carboxydocella sp. ULO1]GAW31797.1 hypothetical protein JDF658_15620 [Carboxydocella sp. JDF658]